MSNAPGSVRSSRSVIACIAWFEAFADAHQAIQREKSIKRYLRKWKINLIESSNPHWDDLYPTLPGVAPISERFFCRPLDPRDKPEDDC